MATVGDYLQRARDSGVSWADAKQLTDTELEARLYGKAQFAAFADRAPIDFEWVHRELRRTGVVAE